MKPTMKAVREKAIIFAKAYWGLDISNIPMNENGRLTRTLGRFRYNPRTKAPICLEFSGRLFKKDYKEETLDGIIKHETCHLALFMLGKPHSDGDRYFENELKRIGSHSTKTVGPVGTFHVGLCEKCKQVAVQKETYAKVAKYLNPKYYTRCCHSKIVYGGTKIYEDNTVNHKESEEAKQQLAAVAGEMKSAATQSVKQPTPVATPTQKVANTTKPQLVPGKRGVSNAQMIPFIKECIGANDRNALIKTKVEYPDVFQSSLKYLGKMMDDYKRVMGI